MDQLYQAPNYKDMSNSDLLVSLCLEKREQPKKLILRIINHRIETDNLKSPVRSYLVRIAKIDHSIRLNLTNISHQSNLFRDVMFQNDIDNIFFSSHRTSKATINHNKNYVSVLCHFLESLYGHAYLKDIDLLAWHKIVIQLKNSSGHYLPDLSEISKAAIRRFGRILSKYHNDNAYQNLIVSSRNDIKYNKSNNIFIKLGLRYSSDKMEYDFHGSIILFREYIETLFLKNTKNHFSSFKYFAAYVVSYNLPKDILSFLSKPQTPSFWDFLIEHQVKQPGYKFTIIFKFTNWVISEYMTEVNENEVVSDGIPLVSAHQYSLISSNPINTSRPLESTKVPPPTSWLFIIRDILTENNFSWPKSISKEYFIWHNPKSNDYENIWIPVITYIFLTMLEIPLRKFQVISSDSGEGDEVHYDYNRREWIPNTCPNARFWSKTGSTRKNRGIISKIPSAGSNPVGFYINTNKTQDRETGFSDLSGYTIPWNNEVLIKYLSHLREWQLKYNPVDKPTKYIDIPKSIFQTSPTKSVLCSIPDRFYLFRHPLANRKTRPDCPPSHNQIIGFWMLLMEELETRLKRIGEDVEIITHRNEVTNQPDACIFSPHGLRVAGLTAFAEAGVPIEILSKIVAGHASILMTIYYVKYNAAHISDILNDAQKNVEQNSQKNFQLWLKGACWEEAKRYVACNAEDGLIAINEKRAPNSVWGGSSLGICPYGGVRCNDGGPIIRKGGKKPLYGPVPGGQGNCVRCRHFISGVPWMIPLWLHGNKLLSDAYKQSKDIDKLKKKASVLSSTRFNYIKNDKTNQIPASLVKEINILDSIIELNVRGLDETLMNAHATYNLLNKIRYILNDASTINDSKYPKNSNQLPLTLILKKSDIGFLETSRFYDLDMLVQASRLYTHVQDEDQERERNNFIDQILFNNDLAPISFSPLTDEEKAYASDAAAKFLISRLEINEIEQLHKGHVTLESLGLTSDIQDNLITHMKTNLNNISFNKSLPLTTDEQNAS